MKDKKVKFDIENGMSMYADEAGIVFNPLKVTFDFRSITPRVDVRNQEYQTLVLRHNVVIMDPYTAKKFLEILEKNLKNYEKQFGKIEKPKALAKLEKKSKKTSKKEFPVYFG